MYRQSSKRGLFSKAITLIASACFILANSPSAYALRPSAAKNNSQVREISRDLRGPKSLGNPIPIIDAYGRSDLEGRKVLLRVDFNVSDDKGNIKDAQRIEQAIPTLAYLMQNGATVILTSHNNRPEGKVKMEYSLSPVAEKLNQLLKVKGYDIRVVFHEASITDKGLAEGLKDKIVTGAINVLENTRFYAGEEKNEEAFARGLAELADDYMYVFDAFGTAERVHASTGGAARFMDKAAIGFLVQTEYQYLEGAARSLYGLIIGGGPKVSEKVPVVKNVIKNIKEGGFMLIGTGPLPAFLKEVYGVEIGQKYTEEDLANAKEILRLAKEKDIRVILPIDFIAVDKNLGEISDDGKKTWLARKEIPKDATFYYLTLQNLKKGTLIDNKTGEEKKLDVENLFIYDIGTESAAEFSRVIDQTPAGSSIFWNGTVGVNEIPRFEEGSRKVGEALVEVTQRGVITAVGGGDTIAAVGQYGFTKKLSHVSTGGGASLALLQGKKLSVISELENIEIQKFQDAESSIVEATGGDALSEFINVLSSRLSVMYTEEARGALIVAPEVFRIGGMNSALQKLAMLVDTVQVVLYGEKAEKIKNWIGNGDIITVKNMDEALAELSKRDIETDRTVILRTERDDIDDAKMKKEKIRQIVSGDIATLAVAKAVKEIFAFDSGVSYDFHNFLFEITAINKVIPPLSDEAEDSIVDILRTGEIFKFPEEVKMTEQVAKDTEKARLISSEFMGRV